MKNKYITHIEEDINANEQDLYANAQNTDAMNIQWIQQKINEQDNVINTETTQNILNEQGNNEKPLQNEQKNDEQKNNDTQFTYTLFFFMSVVSVLVFIYMIYRLRTV